MRPGEKFIEIKNLEITQSITYARRIQQAILPAVDELHGYFSESFILYKPKDIVSGDFLLAPPLDDNNRRRIMIAAADCTGHGVPGAFMSIVGMQGAS